MAALGGPSSFGRLRGEVGEAGVMTRGFTGLGKVLPRRSESMKTDTIWRGAYGDPGSPWRLVREFCDEA